MKKTGFWLILIGVILLAGIAASLILLRSGEAASATVLLDGKVYAELDLKKAQTFTVESQWGSNTVVVENGTVRVEEASCPDHVCVNRGACSGGAPIVCLPNRLVIQFPVSGEVDGSAG